MRLTDEDYSTLGGEKLPSELIPKLLLKLYEVVSNSDPQRCKALHKTLASCRLVCRRWRRIVISERKRFIIRADNKNWSVPSWYMLKRTPLLLQDGSGINQGCQNYREDLMKSHPKFLPELTWNILPGLYQRDGFFRWKDEKTSVVQSTLAACCLVSRNWNRTFNPILYGDVWLGEKNPLITQSLLHRTLRQTPAHKALVKTMTIVPAEDGSTSNLLSICFSMPNLHRLLLDFKKSDLSKVHPGLVHHLRSLSKCCIIQMEEDHEGNANIYSWELLPSYINFTRRSKSTSGKFWIVSSGGR